MPPRPIEPDTPRLPSQVAILRFLRANGPAARIDIGNATGLSPATVTALTAELMTQGLICESPPASSTEDPVSEQKGKPGTRSRSSQNGRGRPKVLLDLQPDAAIVLGIKITINLVEIALGNFRGDVETSNAYEIRSLDLDGPALVETLCDLIDRFFAEQDNHDIADLAGIGIAVQGIADSNSGEIMWSPALHHRHIPIAEPLRQRYGVIVQMTNDANCIATAIAQQPENRDRGDFAVIMLGYGVGMGLVMNGTVYNGPFGAAAEFGHTKYNADGPICNCGKRGCIEAYIGDYALLRDASALISDLPGAHSRHPDDRQMMELVTRGRRGQREIVDLFHHAGKVLGHGIANLIALLGPERILITGSGARAFDLMENGIYQGLDDALVAELRTGPTIAHLPWDKDLALQGAISQALLRHDERIFANPAEG